jgi:hypothetical protein
MGACEVTSLLAVMFCLQKLAATSSERGEFQILENNLFRKAGLNRIEIRGKLLAVFQFC